MAFVIVDRVEQLTRTTGDGSLELSDVLPGRQSFESVTDDQDTLIYVIEENGTNRWEIGLGTVVHGSPTVLQRTELRESSTGSKLDLGSGAHRVFATADAKYLVDAQNDVQEAVDITTANRVATDEDSDATAADRVATGEDAQQTAADRVATGEDRDATAADRVATGEDRTAAADSASAASSSAAKASEWADADRDVEVETGRYSSKHWAEESEESATSFLNALDDHEEATDPHSQYTTDEEAAAIAEDNSVVFALALG